MSTRIGGGPEDYGMDYKGLFARAEERIADLEWDINQLVVENKLLKATLHGVYKREQASTLDLMIAAARGIPAGAK